MGLDWNKIIVKIGARFGRLVVLRQEEKRSKNGNILWSCICDCGITVAVRGERLRRGVTNSCGCYRKEDSVNRFTTHGMTGTVEYNTWVNIRDRCNNPYNPRYMDYGARGIYVCKEWQSSFETFYKDMGNRPSDKHSIDRINNDGPYSKENCRWATRSEQELNKRAAPIVTSTKLASFAPKSDISS